MKRQVNTVPSPLPLIAMVVAVLFAIFGISAGMARVPAAGELKDASIDAESHQVQGEVGLPRPKCAECGVIESWREMRTQGEGRAPAAKASAAAGGEAEDKIAPRYVVTVRMSGGERRELVYASAANLRRGERVILVHAGSGD